MRTSFALLALSAIAAVSAQRKVYSNTDINVGAIDLNLKASWCTAQRNTCNVLCDRTTVNDCEPTTLKYTCTCNNGTAPGLEYYEQTLPTLICTQAFEDCIQANVGDSRGQANCTSNIKSQCGTIKTQAEVATTTTSAPTNTPAGTGSGTTGTGSGSQASQTPATSSSQAYAAPTAVPARYGNAAAVAAIGLFAYML